MKLSLAISVLSSCVAMSLTIRPAEAQSSITEQEVYAIGVDAYLYFYPLVTMDVTRRQLTNVEPGKGLGGPMNTFSNIAEYPTADMQVSADQGERGLCQF